MKRAEMARDPGLDLEAAAVRRLLIEVLWAAMRKADER
jgi:hypothetical protein